MHKLGIIVPYRDRYEHLITFKSYIKNYLKDKNINYELIIVEQDNAKAFNRGKLLNIGFLYAKKLKCDYIVFHDIDMLPIEADYSYSDVPLHLATKLLSQIAEDDYNLHFDSKNSKEIFEEYFGGVTLFPVELFEKINGYSNNYWGWGYEDTDLLYRCKLAKIPLNITEISMVGGHTAALKFNGKNAYVKSKNIFNNFRKKTSIVISFYPDEFQLNQYKESDTFAAFGIPGFDCLIGYNSFSRYFFEIFTKDKKVIHLYSNIKKNKKTIVIVTIDCENNEICFWQDGEILVRKNYNNLYNYNTKSFFYLGCADPNKNDDKKFFKGWINFFAVYNDILKDAEIKEISENKHFGLTQNFGRYKSDYKLELYYDAKFIKNYKLIDLSGNKNDGEIFNCEITPYSTEDLKIIEVPFRRNCSFGVLNHEENGYFDNRWKTKMTRYNQLRYYNEVVNGSINPKNDGITTCEFKEFGYLKKDNLVQINVGI